MSPSTPLAISKSICSQPSDDHTDYICPSRQKFHVNVLDVREADALLDNLSPSLVLQVLSSTEATTPVALQSLACLEKCVAEASSIERALGFRAATAAERIENWYYEICSWQWPDVRDRRGGAGFLPPSLSTRDPNSPITVPKPEYIGSLPIDILRHYEQRLGDIKQDLEALNIDSLKRYVLEAHTSSQSEVKMASQSLISSGNRNSRRHIKDFTAVITITILQCLPVQGQLDILIGIWDVRLAVLVVIPELLWKLDDTNAKIDAALGDIRSRGPSAAFMRAQFQSNRDTLQKAVGALGFQVDHSLDLLEGHEDSLPELWIERMDAIETKFGDWVVEAEQLIQYSEWIGRQKEPESAVMDRQNSGTTSEAAHGPLRLRRASLSIEQEPQTKIPVLSSGDEKFLSTVFDEARTAASKVETECENGDLQAKPPVYEMTSQSALSAENPEVLLRQAKLNMDSSAAASDNPESVTLLTLSDVPLSYAHPPAVEGPAPPHNAFSKLKPPLQGHRRDLSEASFADSQYSAFSDISNAEIVDVTTTEVWARPKISLVNNLLRSGGDDLHAMNSKPRVQSMHLSRDPTFQDPIVISHARSKSFSLAALAGPRRVSGQAVSGMAHPPPQSADGVDYVEYSKTQTLHRASTTSMELIGRGQVREIVLNRNNSYRRSVVSSLDNDGASLDAPRSPAAAESVSSHSPVGSDYPASPSSGKSSSAGHDEHLSMALSGYDRSRHASTQPADFTEHLASREPHLPRRPSKRQLRTTENLAVSPHVQTEVVSGPITTDDFSDVNSSPLTSSTSGTRKLVARSESSRSSSKEETLEAKIKDILTNLPARIRLTPGSNLSTSATDNTASPDSTRATVATPSLTLSPVRQDRLHSRSNITDSEVKVYHLIRAGQPRNIPPVRLHVRLVGERGERVMVRVGGGWADLAEYLREYSLHHGNRGIEDGRLEVASLPTNGSHHRDATSSPLTVSGTHSKTVTSNAFVTREWSMSPPGGNADHHSPPQLDIRKARKSESASRLSEIARTSPGSPTFITFPEYTPPVPVIPSTFQASSATTKLHLQEHSIPTSTVALPSTHLPTNHASQGRSQIGHNFGKPSAMTDSMIHHESFTSNQPSPGYTPLGASGPKRPLRNPKIRAVTTGSALPPATRYNEAWVQSMLGKARQVSAHGIADRQSPLAASSSSPPTGRRASEALSFNYGPKSTTSDLESPSLSPNPSPSPSPSPNPSPSLSPSPSPSSPRPDDTRKTKNRMSSLSNVGGIKRVFLRRKKEK